MTNPRSFPVLTKKKLTKYGPSGTIYIAIPREFLTFNGLKSGDKIPIVATYDRVIILPYKED